MDPAWYCIVGRPGRVMLLQEAAVRAGVGAQVPLFGRSTCLALIAALAHGVVASTGFIGNRVYTDLGEDELYVAIPGKDLSRIADEIRPSPPPTPRWPRTTTGRQAPRQTSARRAAVLAPVTVLSPRGPPVRALGSCGSRGALSRVRNVPGEGDARGGYTVVKPGARNGCWDPERVGVATTRGVHDTDERMDDASRSQ